MRSYVHFVILVLFATVEFACFVMFKAQMAELHIGSTTNSSRSTKTSLDAKTHGEPVWHCSRVCALQYYTA